MTHAPDPNPPSSYQESNPRPPMNEIASPNPIVTNTPPELSLWRWLTEPHESQWLLPATGAWILGLDWFLFSQEAITLAVATPVTAVVGFLGGALGTYFFQSRFADERGPNVWLKALLAGIVVGVPVPLAGTFVGGWILFNSGLASVRERLLRTKK
jgi:small basic protein